MVWNIRSHVYKPIQISVAKWQGGVASCLSTWGQPLPSVIPNRKKINNYWLTLTQNCQQISTFFQWSGCLFPPRSVASVPQWNSPHLISTLPPPLRSKVTHVAYSYKDRWPQNIYSDSKLKKYVNLMKPWKHPKVGIGLSPRLLNNFNADEPGQKEEYEEG